MASSLTMLPEERIQRLHKLKDLDKLKRADLKALCKEVSSGSLPSSLRTIGFKTFPTPDSDKRSFSLLGTVQAQGILSGEAR
jgi:hypothetical protein